MDDVVFRTQAKAIKIFAYRNRRWPSELSTDDDEVFLAQWLNERRHDFAQGKLSARVASVLSSEIPGWRVSGESRWLRYARLLSDQLILQGSLDERTPAHLSLWLQGQQEAEAMGILDATRRSWLDDHAPGWTQQDCGSGVQPRA